MLIKNEVIIKKKNTKNKRTRRKNTYVIYNLCTYFFSLSNYIFKTVYFLRLIAQ
jgi:hypothetical protein